MSVSTNPKDADSGNPSLAALTEALEGLVRGDGKRSWSDQQPSSSQVDPARRPAADVAVSGPRVSFGKFGLWSLTGALVVACAGAIVFAWPALDGRIAKSTPVLSEAAPASISPAPTHANRIETEKVPIAVEASKADNDLGKRLTQVQSIAQRAEQPASVSPETTPQFQMLERRLTGLEQLIENLKASEVKLVRENAELAARLREVQEQRARQDVDVASDIKAAEEKATRDFLATKERLSVTEDQLARISELVKANQVQIDRLSASRQQRVVRPAQPQPSPAPTAALKPPAPKPPPPQARISPPRNPNQSQPPR